MRFLCPLFCVLLLTGCASRSINNSTAIETILEVPQSELEKEDVDVVGITRLSGSQAIVETRLKTAFRIEKVNGNWIVQEIRFGHGQWEKVDNLASALNAVKTNETKTMLERIAEAIRGYKEIAGKLPAFKDYVDLSDKLSPQYLTPLIRLDSWRQPLDAQLQGADAILLRSAGPDGKIGTSDDISRTVSR